MTMLFETVDSGPIRIGPGTAERRRGIRIQQLRPIKVLDPRQGKYFGGQTRDVGTAGLRIEVPATLMLRVGDGLSIHVGLNNAGSVLANRRQMSAVRVVWVNRASLRRKTITAGVEFVAGIGARLDAA